MISDSLNNIPTWLGVVILIILALIILFLSDKILDKFSDQASKKYIKEKSLNNWL